MERDRIFRPLAFVIFSFILSCKSDDPKPATILDIASTNGANLYVAIVKQAEVEDQLTGTGPFTLIAPSDQGLTRYYGITLENLTGFSTDYLKQIAFSQVINVKNKKAEFGNGWIEDLNGNLMFAFTKYNSIGGCALGTPSDLEASNGIVHFQDCAVGVVPDLLQIFRAGGAFKHFKELLNRFPDVMTSLSDGNLTTIITPSDEAFEAYFENSGYNSIADIPTGVAKNVLLYHIVPGVRFTFIDFENGLTVTSALGADKKLTFSKSSTIQGGYVVNGASITGGDIQAHRAFIHTIGSVMVP